MMKIKDKGEQWEITIGQFKCYVSKKIEDKKEIKRIAKLHFKASKKQDPELKMEAIKLSLCYHD